MNLDYDLKRQPVNVTDVKGVIHFPTVPWRTIQEFHDYREPFDNWRKKKKRVLRTAQDWADFLTYKGTVARKAETGVRSSKRPPIVQLFLRCYAHGELGLPGNKFKDVAEFLADCDWRTTVQNVKDAKRRGTVKPGIFNAFTEDELQFLKKVKERWPEFEYERLLKSK